MEEDPALPSLRVSLPAGSRLRYESRGDPGRPPVLFLHGFMGASEDWRAVMTALEDRFFSVSVDLPGHGGSVGLLPGSYAFESAARMVLDVLDELEIDRAAFVGYSMGGRLALYLALRYPERYGGLLLESASPGLESEEARTERRIADERRAARLETGDFDEFLRDWYLQPLFASLARDKELLRRTIEARRSNDPRELAKSLRGMGTGSQPSLWKELAGLDVPMLAVAGELDGKFAGISHRMRESNPQVRTAIVPCAGHNVRLEACEAYTTLLKGFLSDIYNPFHD
ncbi:MAG TPA: 2-succinyl-6-hydroxy-2,4-cyclohexadiene-1-carboxylate synthase [Rubrobacteraceae bacterium]|nr:2-succinyl-6-hydroxy-2,4-cyclohexadiene-1-carboxylate synthase [Rubrobacteraceae bacterium]